MDTTVDAQAPHIIDMLMALTGIALARRADDDALTIVDAVRRFRPHSPRLDSFEGWFCIRRGDLVGAARHLTAAVDGLGADAGPARALLAMVNCARGDPVWSAQAQEVVDNNADPSSVGLVQAIRSVAGTHTVEPQQAVQASAANTATPIAPGIADGRRFLLRG